MAGRAEDSNCSSATSLDDKTEDGAANPTRDALAEGLMCMIKVPTIARIG
jgi:hypothetical protein